jgi:hypothetical protein
MENKLFEFIYETGNYSTEPEPTCLESSLESPEPHQMSLNEVYLQHDVFKKVYDSSRDRTP